MRAALEKETAALVKRVPKLPLSLQLIILTVFLPQQTSLFIAGLRLTATRLILLLLTPIVFLRLSKLILSHRYRFVASDLFVLLASLWMFIGPAATYGISDSIVHSGPIALEFLIAYMSTRVLLSKNDQSLAFINLLCVVLAFVGLDGLLDAATGDFFTRDLVTKLTGVPSHEWILGQDSYRFGLRRATGPLEHPILFGFVCAIGFLFALSIKIRWRTFCIFGCLLGVLLSGSTAPMQVTLMGSALFVYSRMFRKLKLKWALLWTGLAAVVITLFLSTPTPFGHLIDLLTIDPSTAYYRLYIWREVGPAILQSPYFAVPGASYEYTGSVDSVWLVLSLDYGMVCAIFIALSMFGSCSLPTRSYNTNLSQVEKSIAQTTSILILLSIFMGLTVHLYGSSWILAGLLVGLRAHLGEAGHVRTRRANEFRNAAGRGSSGQQPGKVGRNLSANSAKDLDAAIF